VQITPKYIYSGDGKIYRMDYDGKLIDWAQTGTGQGRNSTGGRVVALTVFHARPSHYHSGLN
jgi:hypothetical protein